MQSISTSVVHVCTVRYFILHGFLLDWSLPFYIFLNVLLEIKLLVQKSSNIPYYFADFNKVTMALSGSSDIFFSCAWDLKRIYSVFLSLISDALCPSSILFV